MRKTLLEIVRSIMSEMDSDDVNSINDTVESLQVADIVRGCFEEMVANRNWPLHKKLTTLEASNDMAKPVYLKLPVEAKELEMFRYDCRKNASDDPLYKDIKYKHPDAFLRLISGRSPLTQNIVMVEDFGGSQLPVFDNKAPEWWTSFDDKWIVCDSYNKGVDTTLQKSKSQALLYLLPEWKHTDDAIPDIPEEAFPALVEEAKSTAFLVLKQMPNEKAEAKAIRQRRWLSRKAWQAHGGIRYPNYGRRTRK